VIPLNCHLNSCKYFSVFNVKISLLTFAKYLILFKYSALFNDPEKILIVVGVIGKSNLPNCNKMSCFNLFNCHASFVDSENSRREVRLMKFAYSTSIKLQLSNRVESNSSMRKTANTYLYILRQHLMPI
jgi:hypothetical protein